MGTRELLACLCQYLTKSVRFLWISDMDPNSVEIYSTLKYGCRRTAWAAAETMVCPRLELIGDKETVFEQLESYIMEEWRNTKDVTGASEADMEAVLKKKRDHIQKRMNKVVRENNRSVITGMRNRGYLEHDQVLCRKVEDMENNKGVSHAVRVLLFAHLLISLQCWSLAVFAAVQPQGLEFFLVNTASKYTNPTLTKKPRFDELVSQRQKNMDMHTEPATSTPNLLSRPLVVVQSERSQQIQDAMAGILVAHG